MMRNISFKDYSVRYTNPFFQDANLGFLASLMCSRVFSSVFTWEGERKSEFSVSFEPETMTKTIFFLMFFSRF